MKINLFGYAVIFDMAPKGTVWRYVLPANSSERLRQRVDSLIALERVYIYEERVYIYVFKCVRLQVMIANTAKRPLSEKVKMEGSV